MTHNCHVCIGQKVQKQVMGTTTCTAVAIAFANLFVHHRYRPVFSQSKQIFTNRTYIHDGFEIGRYEEDLEKLADSINAYTPLSITWVIFEIKAIYLDLEIYERKLFRNTGTVDVAVYTKLVSKFLYLHGRSKHTPHVFTGSLKEELIRYLRSTCDKDTCNLNVKY